MNKTFIYSMMVVGGLLSGAALAEDDGHDGEGKDRHRKPPIEALKACEGKSSGANVQFETRNGRTINGVCTLIAVPERLEGGDGDGERAKGGKQGAPAQGLQGPQ